MMAAGGNNDIIRGIYTGNDISQRRMIHTAWGEEIMEIILPDVTHLTIAESIAFIPEGRFFYHGNIVELICHENVVRLGEKAFSKCPHLRRLVLRGVKIAELGAFFHCESLPAVECPKLEIIGKGAFAGCKSLREINLSSARIVEKGAFPFCEAMEEVTFGKDLESVGECAFFMCPSLKHITIPLKNGLLSHDSTFQECDSLRHVHIVEEEILHDTVSALLLEVWRDDMHREICSINDNLPDAPAGDYDLDDDGEKTIVLREWISSVLSKIIDYKAQHRQILNEAVSTLEHLLPNDIVLNNVLSFIELPSYTFDGEEDDDGLEG